MKEEGKMKIGLKAEDAFSNKYLKYFSIIEINSKDYCFDVNIKRILNTKETLKGKEISMHSQTSRIFSCNHLGYPDFNEAELNMLRVEIILCKIMGIKELIFHLKQEKLSNEEAEKLKEILDYADKNNVEPIYEPNGKFIADTCIDVLERFPSLNYCLDLGHFNTAIGNKTLGMPADEFINKIKDRIICIHAHNNNGMDDEHKGINSGTLDWKHILDMLDIKKIRKVIIEPKNNKEVMSSRKYLQAYFKKRKR